MDTCNDNSPPTADAGLRATIIALDAEYQAAVKNNDAASIDRLLTDDFALVLGSGTVVDKAQLLREARDQVAIYQRQESSEQTVRRVGDTAIITAKLWAKGTAQGQAFEYRLWFSDVYIREAGGWRYAFAQAASHLPTEA